jgi:hypothetical protein
MKASEKGRGCHATESQRHVIGARCAFGTKQV